MPRPNAAPLIRPPIIPAQGPVARAPAVLRIAHAAAEAAFIADPTQANWGLLQSIVQTAIDHDDAQRRAA